MTLTEYVARALADTGHAGFETWDDVPQEMQTSFLIDADTAIEAIAKWASMVAQNQADFDDAA